MDSNLINISKIETFFDKILRGALTDNLFFTDAPPAISDSWDEFVVVDCNSIADWDAYGQGTVLVYIYVPPMGASGRKNVAQFSALEQKLNNIIANSWDNNYRMKRRETYSDFDEDKNMFVNIIEISLVVLT